MKISREWATPLAIGAFAIMSVTGILMFFHLDSGLNKLVHEWASWIMVAGVGVHVAVNWRPFKNYFLSSLPGRTVIGLGFLVLAVSFLPLGGEKRRLSPPVLAMQAIVGAPISSVATLTKRPVEQVMEDLSKAGIALPGPEASIDSVIGDNRALQARALGVLLGKQ